MNQIELAEQAGIHIRPEVKKHYPYFLASVREHGANVVRAVLDKGRHGNLRLIFMKNRKDRHQMMQMLDLT